MKVYTIKDKVKFSSEQIILFGLLEKIPNEPSHCYNHLNKSRYNGLIEYCKNSIEYVKSPTECDVIVLPYKFKSTNDMIYKVLNKLSIELNKPLFCFYNDDDDKVFNISENVILFRTSFYNSTKKINEKPLIAFSPDYFNEKYVENTELSIGYCGHTMHGREKYLLQLYNSDINTNFVLRKGFWAPNVPKDIARKQYFDNMENNIFTFCYRGAGNFSYRFYETLMMGRIPILVNTDCVIPFWDKIKNKNIGLIIDERELLENKKDFIEEINKYYNDNKNNLITIQKNNRRLWLEYYSPIGFLNNLIKEQ